MGIEVLALIWLLLLLSILWWEMLLLLLLRMWWLFVCSLGPYTSFIYRRPLFLDRCSIRNRCRWLGHIGRLRRRLVESLLQTRNQGGNGGRGRGELGPAVITGGSTIEGSVVATWTRMWRLRMLATLIHCQGLLESLWGGTAFNVKKNFDMERRLRRGQLHSSFLQQDKTRP